MKQHVKLREYCPACGAGVDRETNISCAVCGKLLKEGYFPLDNLRASYRNRNWQNEDKKEVAALFEENKNVASETAWAFAVYSMVPYLGILFCPGAVLMGGVGILVSYRKPDLGGGRTSALSIAGGFLILAFQFFLWWLLYYIPTLDRHF
jgi:ferredoxin